MSEQAVLVASLPFSDSATYDECGKTWNTVGTPTIVDTSNIEDIYGNKPFKKALFCQNGYVCNTETLLDVTDDFTISCWYCCTSAGLLDGYPNDIFSIPDIGFRCIHGGHPTINTVGILGRVSSTSFAFYHAEPFSDSLNPVGKWNRIVLTYVYKYKALAIYYNNKVVRQYLSLDINSYPSSSHIIVGASDTGESVPTDWYFNTGYIANFEIYKGLAILEDYSKDEGNGIIRVLKRNYIYWTGFNCSWQAWYNMSAWRGDSTQINKTGISKQNENFNVALITPNEQNVLVAVENPLVERDDLDDGRSIFLGFRTELSLTDPNTTPNFSLMHFVQFMEKNKKYLILDVCGILVYMLTKDNESISLSINNVTSFSISSEGIGLYVGFSDNCDRDFFLTDAQDNIIYWTNYTSVKYNQMKYYWHPEIYSDKTRWHAELWDNYQVLYDIPAGNNIYIDDWASFTARDIIKTYKYDNFETARMRQSNKYEFTERYLSHKYDNIPTKVPRSIQRKYEYKDDTERYSAITYKYDDFKTKRIIYYTIDKHDFTKRFLYHNYDKISIKVGRGIEHIYRYNYKAYRQIRGNYYDLTKRDIKHKYEKKDVLKRNVNNKYESKNNLYRNILKIYEYENNTERKVLYGIRSIKNETIRMVYITKSTNGLPLLENLTKRIVEYGNINNPSVINLTEREIQYGTLNYPLGINFTKRTVLSGNYPLLINKTERTVLYGTEIYPSAINNTKRIVLYGIIKDPKKPVAINKTKRTVLYGTIDHPSVINYTLRKILWDNKDNFTAINNTKRRILWGDKNHPAIINRSNRIVNNGNKDDPVIINNTYRNVYHNYEYPNKIIRDIIKRKILNEYVLRDLKGNYTTNTDIIRDVIRNYVYDINTYRNSVKNTSCTNYTFRNVKIIIHKTFLNKRLLSTFMTHTFDIARDVLNNVKFTKFTCRHVNITLYLHNDTYRNVMSYKKKIMTFVFDPRYVRKLKEI